MAKKKVVFQNPASKQRVTIQFRVYDTKGNYVPKSSRTPDSIQVKGVVGSELRTYILRRLREEYGEATEG